MSERLHPGDWITGPFWDGPVQVVACAARAGYDLVTVAIEGDATRAYALTPEDTAQLTRLTPVDRHRLTFAGDPARFRLAIQAHRLRLAHALDPYAALNASRIDPLPHQFEAVYEHLLARPVVRALLAHDAGAGKTVIAGMVIKELQRRQGARRVLIVAPAGLKVQWRRELLTKFGLDDEGALLEAVYAYAKQRYVKAKTASQSAAFALLTLGRRMASSPYALRESLKRMREQIQARLDGSNPVLTLGNDEGWAEWEELTERERWQREIQAETEAVALVSRRQAKTELRHLDDLITRADALVKQEKQAKLVALKQACDVWAGEHAEQLIVFTEFKDTLDYLVARLEAWGYTITQIHGGMAQKERRKAERTFWDGAAQILVATEAAGEGINLQCCSVMINYDIPWNPCRLEQRMGRIHRYGQKASEVHIFNLIAKNTLEGEVQDALLTKLKVMRKDLGDKVFNVVGEVLWGDDLRRALERIAMGERAGVDEAKRLIEQAEVAVRRAQADTAQAAITAAPLDVAAFRRAQATFAAHRLSPEEAEKFFRLAVPFVGGALKTLEVFKTSRVYPAFEVTLPPDLCGKHPRTLRVSFWAAACSDDDTVDDAVLFIAPGHWLFEALLARVMAECAPDLAQGAVFLDLQPASESPYLVWFVRAAIRDGLDRRAGDLLAAVQHRADQETVTALPTEILDAFEPQMRPEYAHEEDETAALRQGQAMVAAQGEIVDGCVTVRFLPELAEQRARQQAASERDWNFLAVGLDALAGALTDQALDAYSEGDPDAGARLTDQAAAAQERKRDMLADLERAGRLLLTTPEVLGVALVLPAPLEIEIARDAVDGEAGTATVPMRRDDAVEAAAMQAVMAYETRRGRRPRDVHQGHSWDIESYDAQGNLLRYIEVKGRGPGDADVVTLTEPEWEAARRLGEQHWLYIVRLEDGRLWMVQNPYAKLQPKELKRWVVKIDEAALQATNVSRIHEV